MIFVQFIVMLIISANPHKHSLDKKWNVISFPGDNDEYQLLSGTANLHLNGVCYGTAEKSPIALDWSKNGFNVNFFIKTSKIIKPAIRKDTLFVNSVTIGPGVVSGGGLRIVGEDIILKVLSRNVVIVWRDDRKEIDFDLAMRHDRAFLNVINYRARNIHNKKIILKPSVSNFGKCESDLPLWKW